MTAQENIRQALIKKLDQSLVNFKMNPSGLNKTMLQKAIDDYQEFCSLIK